MDISLAICEGFVAQASVEVSLAWIWAGGSSSLGTGMTQDLKLPNPEGNAEILWTLLLI